MTKNCKIIAHVDMDAFFASVEQRERNLKGIPVVVGADPTQRGVVSAASYEARKFGIHSAMSSVEAYRRCPHAVFLPVRMELYKAASLIIMQVFESYTPLVEPLSIDEAFLDLTGSVRHFPNISSMVEGIQNDILRMTGLTASIGVAKNKFLAKLASDVKKPFGITYVPESDDDIREFLAPMDVKRIWGVGKRTAEILKRYGINKVYDLQNVQDALLASWLTPQSAQALKRLAFGLDFRRVETGHEEKSVSNEITYGEDVSDRKTVEISLRQLVEKVSWRLRKMNMKAKTVSIKLRFSDFSSITRQLTLAQSTQATETFMASALELFNREQWSQKIRLVGFGVAKLSDETEEDEQLSFDFMEELKPKESVEIDAALDKITDHFGKQAISRGFWQKNRSNKDVGPSS